MTNPSGGVPPQPGWWPRTGRSGAIADTYGWQATASGFKMPTSILTPGYGWAGAASGTAPPLFTAVGAGNQVDSTVNLSAPWAHTITGNGILIGANILANTASLPAGDLTATVGATSIPQLELLFYGTFGSGFSGYVVVFGLRGATVPTGAQTVTVTGTGGFTYYCSADSVSYSSVSGFGTVATNTGTTATSETLSVSSVVGQRVFNIFGCGSNDGAAYTGYSQTSRYNNNDVVAFIETVIGDAAGAATVNFAVTQDNPILWAAVGVPLL